MEEFDEFGMTIKRRLFGKGPARYFHLIWNPTLEGKHRTKLLNSIQKKTVTAYIITSYDDNKDEISRQLEQCGFYLLVTSDEMETIDARRAYSKRDCVEKVFQALKSSLGMDEIGVGSDDNLPGKSLIWFVAAILHSVLFTKTEALRIKDRKNYTVPAQIDRIDEIVADRNLNNNTYARRYKLDKRQADILKECGVTMEKLDAIIMAL